MRTRTARAGLALAPRDNICRLGERPATVLGGSPRLDRSRIYDRNRGVLDRIGDLADDEPDRDRALFALTGRKLLEVRSAGSLRVASAAQHRADAEQPAPVPRFPAHRVQFRGRTPLPPSVESSLELAQRATAGTPALSVTIA